MSDDCNGKYVFGTNGDICFIYDVKDMMNQISHTQLEGEQIELCPFYRKWKVSNKILCCKHHDNSNKLINNRTLIAFGTERNRSRIFSPCHLYIADFESGEYLAKISERHAGIQHIDISPNGKLVAIVTAVRI